MKRKKLWIAFGILCVLGVGGYFGLKRYFASKDWNKLVSDRLQTLVVKGTDSLYTISFKKLYIDMDKFNIIFDSVWFRPDTNIVKRKEREKRLPDNLVDIYLDSLIFENITPEKFVESKDMQLTSIRILHPILKVAHHKYPWNERKRYKNKQDTTAISDINVYELMKKYVHSIKIDKLSLEHVNFTYTNYAKNAQPLNVKDISFLFSDILIDSASVDDETRFTYARDCEISLKDFSMPISNDLYKMKIGSFNLRTSTKNAEVKDFHFMPQFDIEKATASTKLPQERYDFKIPSLQLEKVDYQNLLDEQTLIAKSGKLNNVVIDVFKNKLLPGKPNKVGTYLHQLLMKVQFPIYVKTLQVYNSSVVYHELNDKTKEKGKVFFTGLAGTFVNVTNIRDSLQLNSLMTFDGSAKLMGVAPLKAHFTFHNLSNNGRFDVKGSFGAFDGTALNVATVPLGLVKINKLDVKQLDFDLKLNDYEGKGNVLFFYENLHVDVLEKEDDPEKNKKFKKKGLLTAVAEVFVKHKNEKDNERLHSVDVVYQRDISKGMFNLLWKTIFAGAKYFVGADKIGKDKKRSEVEKVEGGGK